MVSIIVPVYNEEIILEKNILKIFNFCKKNLSQSWQIIISDNASIDQTQNIGRELADKFIEIKYYRTDQLGKGYGVINAWQNFTSNIYIYMDADLATDLTALLPLILYIEKGFDIVVGSRFIAGAQAQRSITRKIFSFGLRAILKLLFQLQVKDAPCGFKAVNQKTINQIIPIIQNKTWFFDTEMLILAQRKSFKIKEIPVVWKENKDSTRQSKVDIFTVVRDYIKNIHTIYVRK